MSFHFRLTLKLSCLMKLEYFPLDEQVCHMNISTCKDESMISTFICLVLTIFKMYIEN